MKARLLVLAVLPLVGCVLQAAPASRPAVVHRPPSPSSHAIEPPGAASIAQSYDYHRGYPSEVKKVERVGDTYEVRLKIRGNGYKGKMRLQVHAWSGAVAVLEESVRQHDPGKHGRGHDDDD